MYLQMHKYSMYLCMDTHRRVCVYTYIYIYAQVFHCICVDTHICVYVCVCVYMYTHISEKAMAPNSSSLTWKIPWMEEPGRLQSMRSLRVGHD